MTSTNMTQRQRQKIESREAILQAGREIFLVDNTLPHEATVETVARRANVSKGTVYLYFDSKESLLATLLAEALGLLEAQLIAAYAEHQDLSPDVRIARLAGAYLEFAHDQPACVRMAVDFDNGQLARAMPDGLSAEIQDLRQRGVEMVAQAIRDGKQARLFRRVDERQVALALWAAFDGTLLAERSGQPDASAEQLFETTLELFLRALKRAQ